MELWKPTNETITHLKTRYTPFFELYECHPSVIKIKEKLRIENKFAFAPMSTAEIMQEISRLHENKTISNGIYQ